jgi:DNA-binding SARP family transcriptional activator
MEQRRCKRVEFRLLGPLEVEQDGRVLAVGGRRQRPLLAVLLLHANTVVPRDRLIDAVWGETPPETAANALQVAVHALRKLLGAVRIVTQGGGYLLRVDAGELDVGRFGALIEQARKEAPTEAAETLREALSLRKGPPLPDLGDAQFAAIESARLEELHLAALEERIAADLALGRHGELVPELEALVAAHPYRERLRREHMLALYRSGRQAEALDAYRQARRTLVGELGIEPGHELQALEQAILRQDVALALPAARAKSNIPAPLTPLVGRRLELAALTALLRSRDARLLTLTGPGGTGKSRLAVEGAWELVSDFGDGVCFVDLASIADPELVGTQILGALEVDEQPGRPVEETLKEALRGRQLLLVLDESLARSEAVELFAARARAVTPTFRLIAENARIFAAICLALDGLPLAIELAAARTRELAPEAMLERLESRLGLLTAGPRDAPVRQRTAPRHPRLELRAARRRRAEAPREARGLLERHHARGG